VKILGNFSCLLLTVKINYLLTVIFLSWNCFEDNDKTFAIMLIELNIDDLAVSNIADVFYT
jgi:hypothetical protein